MYSQRLCYIYNIVQLDFHKKSRMLTQQDLAITKVWVCVCVRARVYLCVCVCLLTYTRKGQKKKNTCRGWKKINMRSWKNLTSLFLDFFFSPSLTFFSPWPVVFWDKFSPPVLMEGRKSGVGGWKDKRHTYCCGGTKQTCFATETHRLLSSLKQAGRRDDSKTLRTLVTCGWCWCHRRLFPRSCDV